VAELEIDDISVRFSGLVALNRVSFAIPRNEITAVIGPNGAGKTTLINVISGVVRPESGRVRLEGQDIVGRPVHQVSHLGIRRTFQMVRLFPGLTVLENMIVAQNSCLRGFDVLLNPLPFTRTGRRNRREIVQIAESFGLADKMHLSASELSYGDQRRVEMARALAGKPKLVLFDEPAAGMNEAETEQLSRDIEQVRQQGVTVLLIEHDMTLVMAISSKIVVLDFGRKIAEGTPAQVRAHPDVISSYLGAVYEEEQ